jgi:hypothetical protein
MGSIFNEDFLEFISLLESNKVEYMLVGGYSVILHGYPRTTGDMDIWVNTTLENYIKLKKCFLQFGLPIMEESQFLSLNFDVFTFGRPPRAIDLMTKCKGLIFETSFKNSFISESEGIKVRVLSYEDLIIAKKEAGRFKDLNDLENL